MTTVLFQSLPEKTLLVLDLISLTTSPAFFGFENVPPGLHFIFTGTDAGLSIRHGLWFLVPTGGSRGREIVFRWFAEEERLVRVESEHAVATVRPGGPGLRDQLGGGLVNYGVQADSKDGDDFLLDWNTLTSYIDTRLLNQVLGRANPTTSTWTITSVSTSPNDVEAEIPNIDPSTYKTNPSTDETETLSLLPVDLRRTWPADAVGRERTEAAQDRSWYLSHIIEQAGTTTNQEQPLTKIRELGAQRLLSELQFTFTMLLLLGNYSCFEQWKRITSLLFTCQKAIIEIPRFFILVLQVMKKQIHCLNEESSFVEAGGIAEEIREEFTAGGIGIMAGRKGRMKKVLEAWKQDVEDALSLHEEQEQSQQQTTTTAPSSSSTTTDNTSAHNADILSLKQELKSLWITCTEAFNWEDPLQGITVLKRGKLELEDGEQVELELEGADEEDEMGEYAPVVVDLG